jgi:Flp pilus assembly protein TadB
MRQFCSFRRAAALFCLAVVLVAAFTVSIGGPPLIVPSILLFCIAIPVFVFRARYEAQDDRRQIVALPVFSPRPPPAV